MHCPSCGFENTEGLKFCEECGTTLVRACPSCGQQVRPTAKFCGGCGTTLAAAGKAAPARSRMRTRAQALGRASPAAARPTRARPRAPAPEAERRQLTVLFCDLVDSTVLSTQLDPEDLREVVQAYQAVSAQAIQQYEGHIAQHLGDGLLVYFGYPVAHEDDAQRAVRAGLDVVAAIQQAPLLRQHGIRVRIGIHTGLVVIGEIGSSANREILALGETPNLAARLQALAQPDTVVISATTARLVQGYFTWQELGPCRLKGISQPVLVYQVLHESGLRTRLQVARATGLTPLVGREQEVALLLQRWEQAKGSAGQVVLVTGEAGIGKSRLLHVLTERVAGEPYARLDFRCSAYHQNSTLYPVIDLLQRALQFRQEDSPQAKGAKLAATFARYSLTQETTLALFADLLSLPAPQFSLPPLTPRQHRHKTLEAAVTVLLTVAQYQPLLLMVEDLHWVDPSTLELFSLLLTQIPTTRILVVFTCRPEFAPPWPSRSPLTTLTLPRLGQRHVAEMAGKVARGKALPPEVLQQVMSRTDGVPLFVEEFTKMVLESGLLTERRGRYELTSPLPPLAIPVTLHDSLMARLDRLSIVKEVAQLGATLGREFSYELIQAVSPLEEAALQRDLARLVETDLLYQTGLPPHATYLFKHALIREAAYQSLLKSTRQRYHQQIARVLAERFPEVETAQPELLAHHYTEAGLRAEALQYWQQAGQRAIERSANEEAISHLAQALAALQTMPDTPERAQHELALHVLRGTPLLMARGYAAPEVEEAYTRARELCHRLGASPQLLPALAGLVRFHLARGEFQTARELGEQSLRLAEGTSDLFVLAAHALLGIILVRLGEFMAAREHLEHGITLYDPRQHGFLAPLYGDDPGVASLSYAAAALWYLGYPDQALEKSREALALAQGLTIPYPQAFALGVAAWVSLHRREGETAREYARSLVTLATEQRFPFWAADGMITQGRALVAQGGKEEGLALVCQGLAAYRATGAGMAWPSYLALSAGAYGDAGQAAEGLPVLAEALAVVSKTGERIYEAELYRLKGELLLQSGSQEEVEHCFQLALTIARRQRAKSWELRAAVSLSRLWQRQGRKEEARQLLAGIYHWFTEGFDTKDLQEAKALLEELT